MTVDELEAFIYVKDVKLGRHGSPADYRPPSDADLEAIFRSRRGETVR